MAKDSYQPGESIFVQNEPNFIQAYQWSRKNLTNPSAPALGTRGRSRPFFAEPTQFHRYLQRWYRDPKPPGMERTVRECVYTNREAKSQFRRVMGCRGSCRTNR